MFIYRFYALKYNITIRNICQGHSQRCCIYFCTNCVFSIDISSFILNSERSDIFIISDENVKVSTRGVPFLSQFFLKKVSEKSHDENAVLIHFPPVITTILLRKNFKTPCTFDYIIAVVSLSGQLLFF